MTALDAVPMPPQIAALPRNKVGYPIPWFVATFPDGHRDFRVASAERIYDAVRFDKCYTCGQPIGSYKAFLIGPMCAVNRIAPEPPSHRDCAQYSARVCPFLSTPAMVRRERGMEFEDRIDPGGVMLLRNPGVTALWITRDYTPVKPPNGSHVFRIGEPKDVTWWRESRAATRAEVLESMESGRPLLIEACEKDDDPAGALQHMETEWAKALTLIPGE